MQRIVFILSTEKVGADLQLSTDLAAASSDLISQRLRIRAGTIIKNNPYPAKSGFPVYRGVSDCSG